MSGAGLPAGWEQGSQHGLCVPQGGFFRPEIVRWASFTLLGQSRDARSL